MSPSKRRIANFNSKCIALKEEFFNRSAVKVARDLIGCFLVIKNNPTSLKLHGTRRFKIVETEAYEGLRDLASHASRGKTERNKVMFGPPGRWYVYFTYGMHHMLNIVCKKEGEPAAVLIRGIASENITPQLPSCLKRGASKPQTNLLGPARLTKELKIDKKFNGLLANKKTGLWVESNNTLFHGREKLYNTKLRILRTPRIGVAYSGPVWSQKKYRFVLEGFETKNFK